MANKITVTSAGTVVNANVTPDSAMYYSNKSKEWAISEKLIDNEDYSSKYYANESKKQANIATAKTTEVVESGNTAVSNIENARDNAITDVNTAGATQVALATEQATIATNKASEVIASGNNALSNIDTAKSGALTDITNLKNTSVSNITTVKNNAITSITTQETTSKNNVIATGNEQVERVNLTGVDNKTPIFSKSEIRTNESIYQNVYDLKHSTFDKTKFTVVGNPTITDEGVLKGTSNGNYLKINNDFGTGSWHISLKFNLSSYDNLCSFLYLDLHNRIHILYSLSIFTNNNNGFNLFTTSNFVLNTDYLLDIDFDGTSTYKAVRTNLNTGVVDTDSYTSENKLISGLQTWNIGKDGGRYFNGSIDLKQFSITVDGKEVFSGNKTGLDVIKADNYEVIGSPVISDDGVASGLSASNYLKINSLTLGNSLHNANSWKIIQEFTYNSREDWSTLFDCTGHRGISSFITPSLNNKFGYALSSDGTNEDISDSWPLSFWGLILGNTYKSVLEFTGTQYIHTLYNSDGTQFGETKTVTSSIKVVNSTNYYIGSRGDFTGSTDLNAFKIYVDGNLVYQSCLKIPYTESKTGSKIVDVAYRDRVIDLYKQEGQAGYYTIDEENKNFTLPMGEIYGMIGQRSLISSTVTETNRVDIYSDKTCLICGNVATAGTINLPIELVNNNYFITLSTSAKTATSFTTTATGDYILIGKVV